MMDAKVIDEVTRQVYRQFPEMNGVKPKVRAQSAENTGNRDANSFLLTYQRQVSTPNGKALNRWVRVVASPDGKIIKISTSK